jgi:hypothetical protein
MVCSGVALLEILMSAPSALLGLLLLSVLALNELHPHCLRKQKKGFQDCHLVV